MTRKTPSLPPRVQVPEVDVLLFLEGTYPYVAGGVSSWVHAIVAGMPDLTFGLLYLGASSSEKRVMKFELPPNVAYILEMAANEVAWTWGRGAHPGSRTAAWEAIRAFHHDLQRGHIRCFDPLYAALGDPATRALGFRELAEAEDTWSIMVDVYRTYARDVSFIDFFYTWRYSHLPVFHLMGAEIPKARVYHTICTGWAGLLAALARQRHHRPMLLTEHGIYVNERRIEISQAEWIYTAEEDDLTLRRDMGYFKVLWTRIFEAMGRLTYDYCDEIYTLYGGNRDLQVKFGGPQDRIHVIPNGVRIDRFTKERPPRNPSDPYKVGFIGRVVPIKDVKTLIRACRMVVERIPHVEFLLMGPTEEDPDYFEECQALTRLLGLEDKLKFLGRVNVPEYYPKVDLQVLTSISEGQPLVILEGFCSGLPCVATNVGSCSELLLGLTEEDKALGPAGIVTQVGNPKDTADAIVRILGDAELWQRMSATAVTRVRKFFNHDDMIRTYREVYDRFRAAPDTPLGPVVPYGVGAGTPG